MLRSSLFRDAIELLLKHPAADIAGKSKDQQLLIGDASETATSVRTLVGERHKYRQPPNSISPAGFGSTFRGIPDILPSWPGGKGGSLTESLRPSGSELCGSTLSRRPGLGTQLGFGIWLDDALELFSDGGDPGDFRPEFDPYYFADEEGFPNCTMTKAR